MELKIPNFCDLKYLIKPNLPEPYDCVCTSLFKMVVGYKKFEKYISLLEIAAGAFFEVYPEMGFLLFIDESITSEPSIFSRVKALRNPNLILIKYTCLSYVKNSRHSELFGSLIRFLPFFDYEGNPTRNVLDIDADINAFDTDAMIKNYTYFIQLHTAYHYDTNLFYEIPSKWALTKDYSIIAARHIDSFKFPLKLLTDYLKCISEKSCEYMADVERRLDYEKYSIFPYGIDEYFLNNIFLTYIKDKALPYSIYIRYVITAPFYYLKGWENSLKPNSPAVSYLESNLKEVMAYNQSDNRTYRQLIHAFDQVFYPTIESYGMIPTSYMTNVALRYYAFILKMYKDKNYDIFSKVTLKKILRNRRYIVKNRVEVRVGNKVIGKYKVADSVIYVRGPKEVSQ